MLPVARFASAAPLGQPQFGTPFLPQQQGSSPRQACSCPGPIGQTVLHSNQGYLTRSRPPSPGPCATSPRQPASPLTCVRSVSSVQPQQAQVLLSSQVRSEPRSTSPSRKEAVTSERRSARTGQQRVEPAEDDVLFSLRVTKSENMGNRCAGLQDPWDTIAPGMHSNLAMLDSKKDSHVARLALRTNGEQRWETFVLLEALKSAGELWVAAVPAGLGADPIVLAAHCAARGQNPRCPRVFVVLDAMIQDVPSGNARSDQRPASPSLEGTNAPKKLPKVLCVSTTWMQGATEKSDLLEAIVEAPGVDGVNQLVAAESPMTVDLHGIGANHRGQAAVDSLWCTTASFDFSLSDKCRSAVDRGREERNEDGESSPTSPDACSPHTPSFSNLKEACKDVPDEKYERLVKLCQDLDSRAGKLELLLAKHGIDSNGEFLSDTKDSVHFSFAMDAEEDQFQRTQRTDSTARGTARSSVDSELQSQVVDLEQQLNDQIEENKEQALALDMMAEVQEALSQTRKELSYANEQWSQTKQELREIKEVSEKQAAELMESRSQMKQQEERIETKALYPANENEAAELARCKDEIETLKSINKEQVNMIQALRGLVDTKKSRIGSKAATENRTDAKPAPKSENKTPRGKGEQPKVVSPTPQRTNSAADKTQRTPTSPTTDSGIGEHDAQPENEDMLSGENAQAVISTAVVEDESKKGATLSSAIIDESKKATKSKKSKAPHPQPPPAPPAQPARRNK